MNDKIKFAFLFSLVLLLATPAAASSLRADILYLLPRESGEVAFVDLQEVRRSPHYQTIKRRVVPQRFAQFERFIRSLGIDVDTDLDWISWIQVAPGRVQPRELFFGIAEGRFQPQKVEEYFRKQKLPVESFRGQTLFPFGSGAGPDQFLLAFLDSSTVVFGTRLSLDLLLETRFGGRENIFQNETLSARISEVNGHSPIWIVMDDYYTRLAVSQLVPEATKFPGFDGLANRFRSALLRADVGSELTLEFHVWCGGAIDAQTFSLLLQTGLAVQGWRLQESNPELSAVLDRADVSSAGDRLLVRLTAREDELRALLDRPVKLF